MGPQSKRNGNLLILVGILCFLLLGISAQAQVESVEKGGEALVGDILLITSESLLVVDMFQTQYILKHEKNHKELNPIVRGIGPNYAPVYFAFWMVATPLVGEYFIPEYRIFWYSLITTIESIAVTNNLSVGVGFSF